MWCSSKRPFWYADWSIRFFRSKLTSPHSIPISFSGSTFNNIEIKLLEVKTLGISELHRKHSGSIWARKSKIFCLSFLYPSSKYVIYIPSLPIMAKIYRDNRVFERRSQKSPKCRLRKWGTDEKHLCVLHSIDRYSDHSMQLAVKDFLNEDARERIFASARKIVKTLRTLTYV